jgi:hypothetical protein
MKSSRRDGVLIEPYKQLRFGIMFLLINLVFSALILLVFGYFISDIYQAQKFYFQFDEAQGAQVLGKLMVPVFFGAGLLVVFICVTLMASARYTHQFYGPLVSIRRFLDDLTQGKTPTPIKLRASDQLQDLVEQLNRLPPPSGSSLLALEKFLDELLSQRQPEPLSLDPQDPLKGLGDRIQKLAQKK